MHRVIFNLVTFGKGGWTWEALYHHIPVFLRNFYIAEMAKAMQRESEAIERTAQSSKKMMKEKGGRTVLQPPQFGKR